MRSFLRRVPAALFAVVLAAGLAACTDDGGSGDGGSKSAADLDAAVVATDGGSLRGSSAAGYRSFLGVPFAAPPVGDLRWRPPQPAPNWSGERDATKPGAACTQPGSVVSGGDSGDGSTTEDCLYLNVYTPTTGTARRTLPEAGRDGKLPVMVWIHGGSFLTGAGSDYGPGRLVTQGGVIVVTINYRLGALGFLGLPELSREQELGSGTYGLLDQQAALRWVQSNITAFGGDPKNVTLFGESAGASSVCAQMVAPQAEGLFAKAISESGCALRGPTQATAEQTGTALAAKLGCRGATVLTCLRGKPAAAIRSASTSSSTSLTYAPASGGPVLPTDIETAFTQGKFQDVPLLQGTNHDEGRLFILSLGLSGLGPDLYPTAVRRATGSLADEIIARYPLSKYGTPGDALGAIVTDATFSCPALRTNQSASKRTEVYAYEFNDPNAPLPKIGNYPLKATHAAELPYLFEMERLGGLPETAQQLSREMVAYWTSFAIDGDPNADGAPKWGTFSPSGSAMQALVPQGSTALPTTSFATEHNCDFWAKHPTVSLRS
ncbi:carboxylesterase/lipase family protein [Cryptosporangium aurantiacum]|uniref:Carboxylic ester hydrolase n=1 Tax=Cryptosporangium aurantiacum TaxID=134849 RepID=A0A1M7H1F1_9ACTN|nr:carboxylesterase/lipase family protein [Cryptosporangium aurantiacum]SHM22238.1 para-nitrobenzyl esterase [Cryptosporangium aurantiacum]